MRRILHARVTAKRLDEVGALVVGALLLGGCTALVWLILRELSPGTTFVLGAAIGAAWLVLAQVAWRRRRR